MRTVWASLSAISVWTAGCVSTTPVQGPDGSEHQLIRCTDTEDCYAKAAEICNGPYQLVDSGTRTSGSVYKGTGWVASTKEVLVRCGAEESTKEAPVAGRAKHDPKPAADAPKDAAGFSFGAAVEDVKAACTGASFEWTEESSNYRCSGTPVNTGLDANARLTFCDRELCKIEVVVPPKTDNATLAADLERVVKTLSKRYGEPTDHDVLYSSACFAEALPDCLVQGSAHFWYIWQWGGRKKLTLALGSRKTRSDADSAESGAAKPKAEATPEQEAAAMTIRIRYDDGRFVASKGRREKPAARRGSKWALTAQVVRQVTAKLHAVRKNDPSPPSCCIPRNETLVGATTHFT